MRQTVRTRASSGAGVRGMHRRRAKARSESSKIPNVRCYSVIRIYCTTERKVCETCGTFRQQLKSTASLNCVKMKMSGSLDAHCGCGKSWTCAVGQC